MQPEQQQRIMGYFIEEAKDHLNTIEQGLLNLQSTIDDPEMVNEVFRAAHSVKGGAAMLGLSSIQKTAHRLEDYFKLLKETPGVKLDQNLETLLLQIFDTLQALLEQLQTPAGLTEETAHATMAEAQPVFEELDHYFALLESQAATAEQSEQFDAGTIVQAETPLADHALVLIFQNDISTQLREMLQLFRQAEVVSDGRDRLQDQCQGLKDLGEAFGLTQWSHLLEVARQAIAHPDNSYRVLAPIVIKEIKQAQNLVLMGRAAAIAPSAELQALAPATNTLAADADLADFFTIADGVETADELDFSSFDLSDVKAADELDFSSFDLSNAESSDFDLGELGELDLVTTASSNVVEPTDLDLEGLFDLPDLASITVEEVNRSLSNASEQSGSTLSDLGGSDRNGPEMGMAELNSLADLFEGEVPDLGSTWQQEEVIRAAAVSKGDSSNGFNQDSNDFADLLFDSPSASETVSSNSDEDLTSLFGDDLLEAFDDAERVSDRFEIPDLLADEISGADDELLVDLSGNSDASTIGVSTDLEDLGTLELDTTQSSDELGFDRLAAEAGDPTSSLVDLGELFAGLDGSDLSFDSAGSGLLDDQSSEESLDEFSLTSLFDPASAEAETLLGDEDSLDPFNNSFASLEEGDLSLFENSDVDSLLEEIDLSEPAIAPTVEDGFADIASLHDPWDSDQSTSPSTVEELDVEELELPIFSETVEDQNLDLLRELTADLEPTQLSETDSEQFDTLALPQVDLEVTPSEALDSLLVETAATDEINLSLDDFSESSDSLFADELGLLDGLLETDSDLSFDASEISFDEQPLETTPQGEAADKVVALIPGLEGLEDDLLSLEMLNLAGLEARSQEFFSENSLGSELDVEDLEGLSDNFSETVDSESLDNLLNESTTVDPMQLELDSLAAQSATVDLDEILKTESSLDAEFDGITNVTAPLDALPTDSFDLPESEIAGLQQITAEPEIATLSDELDSNELDFFEIEPLASDREELTDLLGLGVADAEEGLNLDESLLFEEQPTSSEELSLEDDFLTSLTAETTDVSEEVGIFEDAPSLELEDLNLTLDLSEASILLGAQDELSNGFDLESLEETAFDGAVDSNASLSFESLAFEGLNFEGLDFAEEPSLTLATDDLNTRDLDLLGFESEEASTDFASTDLGLDGLNVDAGNDDSNLDSSGLGSERLEPSEDDTHGLDELDGLLDNIFADENVELEHDLYLENGIAGSGAIAASSFEPLHQEPLPSSSDEMELDDLDDLDSLLEDDPFEMASSSANDLDDNDFNDLDQVLDAADALAQFDNLDALLDSSPPSSFTAEDDFADLESLLSDAPDVFGTPQPRAASSSETDAEFDDLEKMLEDTNKTMGGSPGSKGRTASSSSGRRTSRPAKGFSEQTMRVPVKHLDNLSNLVGELVVNRNSLEQDQERMRQSLDNLLYQVQQLSDVGQRMQDLYERSLLESSLLASRQHHRTPFGSPERHRVDTSPTGVEYDPLEMDRFTGFHSLSQEMIELIVRVRESASDIEFIVDETDQVTRMFRQVTTQLQEGLTRSRMVPFAQAADRLPRAVRDIAMKCGRQAELVIDGRDTLIDKMILEHLYDPLTHLVNNAISHGIESPEIRQRAGKSPTGQITIRAFHQGNQTVLSVSDDGAGIDIERVRIKAVEKGLITSAEAQSLSRLDIYDLLFHPGFSTKDQADDFSGRGVGMDVVRTSLSEIRGAINTDSVQGKGTTFTIRLPLTLSISKALCCISDRARIAFPMDGVEDMLDVPKERLQINAEGQPAIAWRDIVLPVHPLNELLAYSRHLSRGTVYGGGQDDDMVSIVVLRSAGNYLALQVDQVLGEQEIVIKQLEGPIPKPVGVAGATVLGDGRIMPIADVLELIDLSMGRIRRDVGSMWEQGVAQGIAETVTAKTEPMVLIVDDSITVRELLSMTFNKVGYRVEQARDGQEAWEKLRSGLPCDIVFCDIEMPRMDGLELLSRIQKDPNLSNLPIAMLTSRGADRHRQMAASLGASGYFTKPYLEEALLDAAQRMLKGEVLLSSNS
ncbi:hybrid sensor histidine kinase/response regulator [Myxacorys almedinensis]|uniref:histidine kinase n=1 Tax=Myxacorys almedinensis A TaxID=2690445 RepID=A0A8J8CK23_9CYAN|nr:hybrid sensor histidine kinase/response regulator [Myxacorys almedinensis]NDJ19443.1 response regulator [Myxacorys almedinensis A]